MIHTSWLGIWAVAAFSPVGQLPTAIALLVVGLLLYSGFRERYLVIGVGGWTLYLLSQEAAHAPLGQGAAALANIAFVLAVTAFSLSAMLYTDQGRGLKWIYALCLLGMGAGAAQGFGFPTASSAHLAFQVIYHAIALVAATHLFLFARGRRDVGPWIFALTLVLLHMNSHALGGRVDNAYDFASAASLRLSILFMVLDESKMRALRLDVVNTVATVAVGTRDYIGMVQEVMRELCGLHGAKFAWFQSAEGEGPIMRAQVGLPGWLAGKVPQVPLPKSEGALLAEKSQPAQVSVRSLEAELRDDLERAGMRNLVLIPVVGETTFIGVLVLGFRGRRSFTAEQLRFLRTTGNQMGIAGENLHMFEQVLLSKRQWLTTIDAIEDYILVHDAESRVLRLNRALARRLGRGPAELTMQPLAAVLPNSQNGCPYCELAKQTDGEVLDPCFGGYSSISTSSYEEDQAGKVGIAHIISDRTERRAGEERYRLLFETVQEGVFQSTPEGKLITCNPAFISMLGYEDRDEILNLNLGEQLFLSPDARSEYTRRMTSQGHLRNYEIALRRKDGMVVTVMENSFATRDALGKIERYQGFLVDITEKKKAEEDMHRRNRELGALNAMASLATRTFDLDEILQNTLRWTTELYGQHCDILLFDPDTCLVTRSETSRANRNEEREQLRRLVDEELADYFVKIRTELLTEADMQKLPLPVQSWITGHGFESFAAVLMYSQRKTLGMLLISSLEKNRFTETDLSLAIAIARQLGNSVEKVLLYEDTARAYDNLRNTQEQLLQSEKMSALGQLISGVAHELNNPLTAILGYAQLLETEPIGTQALDFVRKLYKQTQRTHRVVQNLLSFSRQRKPVQSQVDLRRVLEDALSLREFDLKLNNVIVERSFDPGAPFITGDAHQLEQVFLNIINNAVDAIMDSAPGGKLKVRIYPEGDRACIEFRDSGPGLKDPKKIFDPFYTTKKIGKGTGLGLSICYGIVKEHGGDIIAFNHDEGGALFQLKLPVNGPRKPMNA